MRVQNVEWNVLVQCLVFEEEAAKTRSFDSSFPKLLNSLSQLLLVRCTLFWAYCKIVQMQSCLNMKKNEDIMFRSSRTSGVQMNSFNWIILRKSWSLFSPMNWHATFSSCKQFHGSCSNVQTIFEALLYRFEEMRTIDASEAFVSALYKSHKENVKKSP